MVTCGQSIGFADFGVPAHGVRTVRNKGPKLMLRVVLADDHTLVLEAFKSFLSTKFDVVGTATDGRELIRVARETEPDVVVTDIVMPGLNGIDASDRLRQHLPDTRFVFLTVKEDPDVIARVLQAGACGYLLKNSPAEELTLAIETVARGQPYVTPRLAQKARPARAARQGPADLHSLTLRQREILQLLAEGRTMKEAAEILHLSPRTVAFHKYRCMERLGIENNADLVAFAYKHGLVSG